MRRCNSEMLARPRRGRDAIDIPARSIGRGLTNDAIADPIRPQRSLRRTGGARRPVAAMSGAPVAGAARVAAVDGLRGLLAVVVLAWHVAAPFGLAWLLPAANLAVATFFVLSGYVLTRGWDGRYGVFLIRRFLRLWPVYAACASPPATAWRESPRSGRSSSGIRSSTPNPALYRSAGLVAVRRGLGDAVDAADRLGGRGGHNSHGALHGRAVALGILAAHLCSASCSSRGAFSPSSISGNRRSRARFRNGSGECPTASTSALSGPGAGEPRLRALGRRRRDPGGAPRRLGGLSRRRTAEHRSVPLGRSSRRAAPGAELAARRGGQRRHLSDAIRPRVPVETAPCRSGPRRSRAGADLPAQSRRPGTRCAMAAIRRLDTSD